MATNGTYIALVAKVMDDIRRQFPKDEALALALAGEGVVGEGGHPYSSKTVSAWATGKGMPPAHVLMAAARLAGVRLDAYLHAEPDRLTAVERGLEELRGELARLAAEVRDGR